MKKTILVIEDDPAIAEVIKIVLTGEGYAVKLDPVGKQLFRKSLIKPGYALILVDYLLPQTNGAEIVKRIKKDSKLWKVPIVLMSANTVSELKEIARECKVKNFLAKPFDIEELITIVKQNT